MKAFFSQRGKLSADEEFARDYTNSGVAPMWFQVVMVVIIKAVAVGILYAIAKFVSIEAALVVYVLWAGVVSGCDSYAEHRDMHMFLWNDKQLDKRITTLEESAAHKSGN